MARIAIIGAGISGLSTAFALQQAGHHITLFEARERPGGPIQSDQIDGYLIERGPQTLLMRSAPVAKLIDELGLTPQIVDAHEQTNRRYIVKHGTPQSMPSSAVQAIKTPLLSPAARLRIAAEPLIPRQQSDDHDETLASFVTRRLGEEFLNYFVDPFVGGIWAGNPHKLSAHHAFPALATFEQNAGSITFGALKSLFQRIQGKTERFPSRLISFDKGLQTLTDALSKELGPALMLQSPVRKLRRDPDGSWRVIFQRGKSHRGQSFDALLLTIPPTNLLELKWENASPPVGAIDELTTLPYAPLALLHLGYRRQDVSHALDGLGVLIPSVENFNTLGALFISTSFPDRAPKDHIQLAIFIGGARQPHLVNEPDDILRELAHLDVSRLLGIQGQPTFSQLTRYERAIPQYDTGHQRFLDRIHSIEKELPGIFFAGNYQDGIGVPALIDKSVEHSRRIDEFLGS